MSLIFFALLTFVIRNFFYHSFRVSTLDMKGSRLWEDSMAMDKLISLPPDPQLDKDPYTMDMMVSKRIL